MGGGPDPNLLDGGIGNDTLVGGPATDTLSGGADDDTYGLTPTDVIGNETAGSDTAVLTQSGSYTFADIETVRTSDKIAASVNVVDDDVETFGFGAKGGTINYSVRSGSRHNMTIDFGDGADTFVISTSLATLSTGIVDLDTGNTIGFFWGFTVQDIGANDRIDLSDLGIVGQVAAGTTLTLQQEQGVYLLGPNARIERDDGSTFDWEFDSYTNNDTWYIVDLNASRFSPYFDGSLSASNFLI
jgi:hypothetical protein